MRSAILLFALAVPSALAATTYTNPLAHQPHAQKQREISMTFVTVTGQDRAVEVNGYVYKLSFGKTTRVSAPVGATVRLVADQDSKLDGTVLLQVAADDADRVVRVQ